MLFDTGPVVAPDVGKSDRRLIGKLDLIMQSADGTIEHNMKNGESCVIEDVAQCSNAVVESAELIGVVLDIVGAHEVFQRLDTHAVFEVKLVDHLVEGGALELGGGWPCGAEWPLLCDTEDGICDGEHCFHGWSAGCESDDESLD